MPRLLLTILILALARVSLTACSLSMSLGGACAAPLIPVAIDSSLPSDTPSTCCRKPASTHTETKDGAPERAPAPRPSSCCEMLAADPAKTEPLSGKLSLTLALLPTGRTLPALAPRPTPALLALAPAPCSPAQRRATLNVWTI